MNHFELWYPVNNKPFTLNQAWGIYNPAYLQFGFDHHNGIDLPMPLDKMVYCPIKAKVTNIGSIPTGAGNYVELITTEKWEVNGTECYVQMIFMHNEKVLVKVGDICEVGTQLAIPDNTGFSTGQHIHFGCYRLKDDLTDMDTNNAHGSFDPLPFFNGFYANETKPVIENLTTQVSLLQRIVALLKKLFNIQ